MLTCMVSKCELQKDVSQQHCSGHSRRKVFCHRFQPQVVGGNFLQGVHSESFIYRTVPSLASFQSPYGFYASLVFCICNFISFCCCMLTVRAKQIICTYRYCPMFGDYFENQTFKG